MTPARQDAVAWSEALQAVHEAIASTRMAGLPVVNPVLRVQVVGMEPVGQEQPCALCGVLITPWFMNLVWCPADPAGALATGRQRTREIGGQRLDFIGAWDERLGSFERCTLFSPMFQFADQDTAVATAEAVLVHLRRPAPARQAPPPAAREGLLARRRFLLGQAR